MLEMNFKAQKRYWTKVEVCGLDECWEWTACRDKAGYGRFGIGISVLLAHRVSWQLAHPDAELGERHVCHSCDNPCCVNPAHLWAGTNADNVRDRDVKGRQVAPRGERSGSRLHPESRPRGENHKSAKLNDEKVRAIRADTRLHREIAVDYDVTRANVSDIKARKTWKHVLEGNTMSALDDIATQNNTPSPSPYSQTPAPCPRKAAGIPSLVAQFREADVARANPPEAATVLETQTAPEVAGHPEPLTENQVAEIAKATELEKFNAERVARGEKPLKRMPPPKTTRRTAPVVQVELDAANAFLDAARITIHNRDAEIQRLNALPVSVDESAVEALAIAARQHKHKDDQILSLQQQRAELAARYDALRANEARAADVAAQMSQQIADQKDTLSARDNQIESLKHETSPERSTPIEILVCECEARGWKVTLSR